MLFSGKPATQYSQKGGTESPKEKIKYYDTSSRQFLPAEERKYSLWLSNLDPSKPQQTGQSMYANIAGPGSSNKKTKHFKTENKNAVVAEMEYSTKIMTRYDEEKCWFLQLMDKGAPSRGQPEFYQQISISIAKICIFLLCLSDVTGIKLMYEINCEDEKFTICSNDEGRKFSLAIRYLPDKKRKKGAWKDEKTDFENGVTYLNKNVIEMAHLLGCKVSLYQNADILPLSILYSQQSSITGELHPGEIIDNSHLPSAYKYIEALHLKEKNGKEIEIAMLDKYF